MGTNGKNAIQTLWEEVRDLTLGNGPEIAHLPSPPSPIDFLRRHVAQNKPCLISNAVPHWPALSLWAHSDSYLLNSLSDSTVSLHLTPTGRADSISPSGCFVSAHVDTVPFQAALELIYSSNLDNEFVAYAQQQNDCFRSEYSALSEDCESHIPWASEALGCLPEAVNLWIGNEFSETSFHKDHYENLYAVVTGEKHFLLLPPTDVHRMYIQDYPAAKYCYCKDTGEFTLELEDPPRYVPWSSVDPYPSEKDREREMAKYPLYFNGSKPFAVTVKAGEILYL